MIDGKKLRRDTLGNRDSLSKKEQIDKSEEIQKRLFELDEVKKAQTIFIYVNFRSEVRTIAIIESLMEAAKKVTVPITLIDEKRLEAVQLFDLSKDLIPGYCGIPEPDKSRYKRNVIAPENIDIVILPGSVFDERGGRFGYGGGFYDRFLEGIPQAIRIGLAFELQTVVEAPIKEHDEILDYIITEKRIIKGLR